MAYQKVSFHIFEEDLVPGLTVVWLQTEQGLVPHTWSSDGLIGDGSVQDFRPASFSNREDDRRVDTEVYGGTMEQFLRARKISSEFQEIHGREQGVFVHFPRSKRV